MEGLGESLKLQGKWDEAERTFREAIQIQSPLAAQLPETTEYREDLALSLSELGEVLHLPPSTCRGDIALTSDFTLIWSRGTGRRHAPRSPGWLTSPA